MDSGGKPSVTALQAFEDQVLEDLWAAVQFEFPPAPAPLSALKQARQAHRHFEAVR